MSRDLTTIRRDTVRLLKRYRSAGEEERTPILRSIAENFVDAREHFSRPDGSPDWKGRSHPYRMWVRDTVSGADYPPDMRDNVQAAVRYHLGSVLRERLDDETREAYGLAPKTPRQSSADRKKKRSAYVQALTARDLSGGALVALSAAHTVLSRLEPKDLSELDGHAREVAEATLADLERRIKHLRRRMK